MNNIYGYARCSTNESKQDIDRQRRELKSLGVTEDKNIYWEYESGKNNDRVEFNKLLDVMENGSTLITTEVSRLTRSTKYLCEILNIVKEKKIKLVIGNLVFDCSQEEIDVMTKGMLMMFGVFAEIEADMISARVKSGMANAKAKGKQIGRPTLTREELPTTFIKYYPIYKNKQMNVTDLSKVCECGRATIYRYLKVMEG